jgi:hypothetical protein
MIISMKKQEKLSKSKLPAASRTVRKYLMRLAVASFFLSALVFIFCLPAPLSAAGNGTSSSMSMSMSGSEFTLHSSHYRPGMTFMWPAAVIPTVYGLVLFFFFRNAFIISFIYPNYLSFSRGVRAPPFQAC